MLSTIFDDFGVSLVGQPFGALPLPRMMKVRRAFDFGWTGVRIEFLRFVDSLNDY